MSNHQNENEDYLKDSTNYKNLKKKNEFSKENSNLNIIYDGMVKEQKYNFPSSSQTYYSTNGLKEERNANGDIIFNDDTSNEINDSTKNKNFVNRKTKRKRIRKHNDSHLDNIRSSIKNKFFNFIISFFNGFVTMLFNNKYPPFIWINYSDKNKITKNSLNEQFNMPMEEILKLDIQENFSKYPKDFNKTLLTDILNDINQNYNFYLFLFEMPLYEFYLRFFVNGNRDLLEKEYNLPNDKKALLLNEIILNLKKEEVYKNKYKKTAENLLEFSGINLNLLDNINENLNKNNEEDIFYSPYDGESNNNSINESENIEELFLRERNREDSVNSIF